jgi:aspartyl-tRNA synthetase
VVRLVGWVHRHRVQGGLIFVDLRDRYGVTQTTFNADDVDPETMTSARRLRSEFVVAIEGKVGPRPDEMRNPHLATGEIEVLTERLEILNESAVLPFGLEEHDSASDDLRLEYRYLDLRRDELQESIALRHRVCQAVRQYLDDQAFLEIETPILVRPTPEGARDYLVPSRNRTGHFYALPQSPQLYKQILMISGFDRYYQIARCLRDEDLRADRQPEFTQIDLEMSFVNEEDVYAIVEGMMAAAVCDGAGSEIETPFPRVPFREAMDRYGSDKPDIRFGLELSDVSDAVKGTSFRAFAATLDTGGVVKALRVPAEYTLSRKIQDELEAVAKLYGAKGLARTKVGETGFEGGVAKFLGEAEATRLREALSPATGDTLLFVADTWRRACQALGSVRLEVGRRFCPPDPRDLGFLWVNEFPIVEEDPETGRLAPSHHVFTMPRPEDLPHLDTDPRRVHGQLYDLVLNGVELGSGSVRVHIRELQERLLALIGIDQAEAERRFGFLLKALEYGAPPHGGIALGLERIIMILTGRSSIRDTIAFPKTTSASSLMDGSPSPVNPKDLAELHLALVKSETPAE